jgi:hypothetical protein
VVEDGASLEGGLAPPHHTRKEFMMADVKVGDTVKARNRHIASIVGSKIATIENVDEYNITLLDEQKKRRTYWGSKTFGRYFKPLNSS